MKNRDIARIGLWVTAGAALSGFIFSQTTRQRTPSALSSRQKKDGEIELREYSPAIAAQVEIEGQRDEAIKRGFRTLADFIFGDNIENSKIAMTTPVLQQDSEQIEMSAPLMQRNAGRRWTVQFIMPDHFTLDTLPQPNNPLIAIRELPARQVAVIRFAGSSHNNARILQKTAALEAHLDEKGLKAAGSPVIAFYDPPWTLPFLRRNEVMIELVRDASEKPAENERPIITEKPVLVEKQAKLAKKR